jgi:hypothetical protein
VGLGIVGLALLLWLPAVLHPRAIDDEAIYAVVAIEMVEGGRPYVDAVERKPPGLFWAYALIVGLSGKYNWFALHAVGVAWVVATAAVLGVIGRRLHDPATGFAAALLYVLYQPWATWKNLALNGEVLMNLPIALGTLLVLRPTTSRLRPDLLPAGALLAAAFLLKQPAAIAAVPLGAYLLLPRYRRGRGLAWRHSLVHGALFTAGFWGALGLVAALLHRQGILGEAYFWTITHHNVPHGLGDPVFWLRCARMTLAFAAAAAPLVIGAVEGVRARWDRGRPLWTGWEPEFAALVALLAASALGTAASGRFYPHYYIQLVLPLALLAAPIVGGILAGTHPYRVPLLRRRVLAGWLGLTALGFATAHAVGLARQRWESAAGRYVREHSAPDDRIFVWGQAPGIYLDARRRPASRYVATFPLTGYVFGSPLSWDPAYDTSHRIVPGAWDRFAADVARHPPRFVVDTDAARAVPRYPVERFPVLDRLLRERYQVVYRGPDAVLYARRDPG